MRCKTALAAVACLLFTVAAQAETKVEITGVHLCCPGCVKAVGESLKDVKGVKHEADQDNESITLTAETDEAAQKAIDALATSGFHGKLEGDKFKFKPVADVPKGKVARLELAGTHNCCGACTSTIKKTLKAIDGVTADTVKPRAESFVVEGDFSAEDVVKALLDAGFHVSIKKK